MSKFSDYFKKRPKISTEPTSSVGFSKDKFVIQQHFTFTKKDDVILLVIFLDDLKTKDSYGFLDNGKFYGAKALKKRLKDFNAKNLMYIPFSRDEVNNKFKSDGGIKTLDDVKKYITLLDDVKTFTQLLIRVYGSESSIVKKLLLEVKDRHAFLYMREKVSFRVHLDIRIPVNNVLKSFVSSSEKLPNQYKNKMFIVESEDHPMSYGNFEGVIPLGYGMGYVRILDIGKISYIKNEPTSIKFRADGEYLNGVYSFNKINKNVWVFNYVKDQEQGALEQKRIHFISRPSYLVVNYKYNLTMSPVSRPATYLQEAILKKHADALYNGKQELLISPVYVYKGMTGCVVSLDFDGSSAKSDVKKFLNDIEQFGLKEHFYVTYTGGGYHVNSFFGFNDFDIAEFKKYSVWKRYASLDVVPSFRDTPTRVPFIKSVKNNITTYAVRGDEFDKLNEVIGQLKGANPSDLFSFDKWKKLVSYYLFAHDFAKENKYIKAFFKFLETFSSK